MHSKHVGNKNALFVATMVAAGTVLAANYYVSTDGNDGNDGLSLATAKRTIQAGIDAAVAGDTVWINDGIYLLGAKVTLNKAITVRSINGAALTIVDGNNAVRCFDVAHADAILMGLTIQNGRDAAFLGVGGVVNSGTLRDCTVVNNNAPAGCGGVFSYGTVENCQVYTNVGLIGGVWNLTNSVMSGCNVIGNNGSIAAGIVNHGVVSNCTIYGNVSTGGCGGVFNNPLSELYDCEIGENLSTASAGGVHNIGGIVENCTIYGNQASEGAGLVNTNDGIVQDCVISGNIAETLGGGAINADGTIDACNFVGNQVVAGDGGGVCNMAGGLLKNSVIISNSVPLQTHDMAGGVYNEGGETWNCYVAYNSASVGGGLVNNKGLVKQCLFERNQADCGGGIYNYGDGARVWECIIRYNAALTIEGLAGGVYNEGNAQMRNCLIVGNLALGAGGVVNEGAIYNCTIAGNEALAQVGGLVNFQTAQNCIISSNYAPTYPDYFDNGGQGSIIFSCLSTAVAGEGNIAADPRLINLGSGHGTNHVYGDYRLAADSPCTNAGRNEGWMLAPGATDLDGNTRIIYGTVDMGAFEYFAAPTDVIASDGAYADFVRITWSAPDPVPTKYEIWRAKTNDCTAAVCIADTTELTYDDVSAVPGALYYYWVRPVLSGVGPFSALDTGWRAMTSPAALDASDGLYTDGVVLSWQAGAGAVNYRIYRAIGSDFSAAIEIGQPNSAPWTDTSAGPGTIYHYWVCSVGEITQSAPSDPDTGWRRSYASCQNFWSDFDGDGLLDLALFNHATGIWRILLSSLNYTEIGLQLGGSGHTTIAGDFNGDGRTDPAVYRESTGEWMIFLYNSGIWQIETRVYGGSGWQAAPADYDGDGRTDPAIYQRSHGEWRALLSRASYAEAGTQTPFGGAGWQPAPADYDGDGRADPAIYSATTGNWLALLSAASYQQAGACFGGSGWWPIPADFDGDFKADPAVYHFETGGWRALLSASNYQQAGVCFGGSGWWPLPADYDGDNKADIVIYNQTTGQWRGLLSSFGYAEAGAVFGGVDWQTLR